MNFSLHQLQIFLKVAQTKSITKAAAELLLTQPAVSIQIKNLQDQFEIPLIEVVGRKIFITGFGKEIAASAESIFEEVKIINSKAAAYKSNIVGKLKITSVSTGKYIMPYFLSDFMRHNNEVDLVMDVTNRDKVIESLSNNEIDFALVSVLPEKLKVEQIDLLENNLYLVGSKYLKYEEEPLDKTIFNKIPLIFREQGSGTRNTMEKFLKQNNINAIKKMELTSNEAVKQAVIAGLGYSIMPIIGIRNELGRGDVHIIKVKGLPLKSNWSLIWLKSKKLAPVANAFIEFIQNEKERIVKDYFLKNSKGEI
ncbi:LysR family transcriptional regulator [Antarcticibacterium sp. 1MA-6-2]|uniref:LysR family transcriptional regulator n=1 Tax=Antarcticibacterium sp. 1MA-6-2 TaxID=2908210 RepID=UPI001F229157|nr:LysR family transcriptional regulator [Antarcticibacterium sp. 1MA-6-2]UJH92058.1 LysR family transcriptional regulator [Antarcticibacterium sp. 1MA-6-2]